MFSIILWDFTKVSDSYFSASVHKLFLIRLAQSSLFQGPSVPGPVLRQALWTWWRSTVLQAYSRSAWTWYDYDMITSISWGIISFELCNTIRLLACGLCWGVWVRRASDCSDKLEMWLGERRGTGLARFNCRLMSAETSQAWREAASALGTCSAAHSCWPGRLHLELVRDFQGAQVLMSVQDPNL